MRRIKGDERLRALRETADKAADTLQKMLNDDNQFYRHAYTDKSSGETLETLLKLVNVKQFREVVGAIRDLTDAIRSLYGMPTIQETEALKLNKRKLKLDEIKQAAGEDKSAGDTGVVILPGEEAAGDA